MNTDPWGQNGLTQAAVIAGVFACWASAVKMNLTNATHVVLGDVPTPSSYGIPFLYGDSHSARLTLLFEKNRLVNTSGLADECGYLRGRRVLVFCAEACGVDKRSSSSPNHPLTDMADMCSSGAAKSYANLPASHATASLQLLPTNLSLELSHARALEQLTRARVTHSAEGWVGV